VERHASIEIGGRGVLGVAKVRNIALVKAVFWLSGLIARQHLLMLST
jgi:hypothetical protein